ncbi:MAG: protein translocase subunit SecD [Anaerolineales bacterium]|nr:protein translocase subunit SecD [Anaerolineales bacterium]
MQRRPTLLLVVTAVLVALAVYVVLPGLPLRFTLGSTTINQDLEVRQGLDLRGGLQILLEADVPAGTTIDAENMRVAKEIVENRVNALGLTEPLVQVSGDRRILVELPGISDPEQAIATLKETGLLEFVDMGNSPLPVGSLVLTDCLDPSKVDCANAAGLIPTATVPPPTPTVNPAATATTAVTDAITPTTAAPVANGTVYHTVMTGVAIADATVTTNSLGQVVINFTLTPDGAAIFGAHTAAHIGQYLAIVLDKAVISAPQINGAISGQGTITGNFTRDSANQLALQLRYGSLPVPLKVVQSQEIGATLGQDSIRKSAIAGIVGIAVVMIFMLLYYRLPGAIAVVALAIYAVLTFALFILIPVTLTLPGIAGFVLSVGVAVDANILIFERMKEELRGGRSLTQAVEAGFRRAWPSIRDSNISTLITCAILYLFGSTFGASIVKGFALTLALGVGVSLFTAILVTRTILHLFLDRIDFSARHSWFGI